jgi:hypothetical protein
MNTMPQFFDARPQTRPVPPLPATRPSGPTPGRAEPNLTLVRGGAEAGDIVFSAAVKPAPARPAYGLNGRRHLASVPERQPAPQAAAAGADNADMAEPWTPRRLEPLAFALVLLVSVAALAVALRAG